MQYLRKPRDRQRKCKLQLHNNWDLRCPRSPISLWTLADGQLTSGETTTETIIGTVCPKAESEWHVSKVFLSDLWSVIVVVHTYFVHLSIELLQVLRTYAVVMHTYAVVMVRHRAYAVAVTIHFIYITNNSVTKEINVYVCVCVNVCSCRLVNSGRAVHWKCRSLFPKHQSSRTTKERRLASPKPRYQRLNGPCIYFFSPCIYTFMRNPDQSFHILCCIYVRFYLLYEYFNFLTNFKFVFSFVRLQVKSIFFKFLS